MTPMTIRINPTIWMSMPASVAVTAKYRIAPTAIRKSDAPIRIARACQGAAGAASSKRDDTHAYTLQQVNWHTPAEHEINGRRGPHLDWRQALQADPKVAVPA